MPLKVLVVPLKSIGAMELEMNGFLRRTAGLQPSACPKAEARPFQSPSAERGRAAADYKSALRSRAAIGRTPKAQPSLSPTATRSSEVSVALSGFESVRASSGRLCDRVGVAVGLTSRWPGERTSVRAGVEGLTSNRTRHPPPGASG